MQDTPDLQHAIDELLHRAVQQGDVVGVAAMVCGAQDVTYAGAFGQRSQDADAAMSLDTVCRIMSMTKPLTGTAAMQLVEQGRLDLDAPAGRVCEWLGEVQVFEGFDRHGEPRLRPPRAPVTLRNLLTHSSGFAYDIWNAQFQHYLERTGTPSLATLQKQALRVPLMFDPGARWEYGLGIDWVGQMVEAVSGVTLGEYFAEHVTGPLGMVDTAFTASEDMVKRMASTHSRLPDGELVAIDSPLQNLPEGGEFEMGGGGLLSTAEDYTCFVQALLNDGAGRGARILQPATVDVMSNNQMGALRVNRLVSAMPELSNDAEFFPGEEKSWGLTFQINEDEAYTGRSAGTLMWAGLTNCYFWADRRADVGGVFLTQTLPFVDERALQVFYEFEACVYIHLKH